MTVEVANIPVVDIDGADLIRVIEAKKQSGQALAVFFANANFIVRCQPIVERLRAPSLLIVNDGVGMDLASLWIRRRTFCENLNGTDFIPRFFAASARPWRVFLLGARQEVLDRSAKALASQFGQTVVGTHDGYHELDSQSLIDQINAANPDLLLVGLGNPIQEEWILKHQSALNVKIVFGVGAYFDFLSGIKPRAPRLLRKLRLEWVFRLAHEPRRLGFRYSFGVLQFFWAVFRSRSARGGSPNQG